MKYKGKGLLCGNIVGNVSGCLDIKLQNTKPSSLCQFPVSLLKMPKSTKEISKESRHGCRSPPSVTPNVLEAAGHSARWAQESVEAEVLSAPLTLPLV